MAKQILFRRGNTPAHSVFTGGNGELTVDTDKHVVVVHDGSTAGGYPMAKESTVTAGLNTKVTKNADILPATGTKVTYDAKGLVTGSTTLSASDIPNIDATKINSGSLDMNRLPLSGVTAGTYKSVTVNDKGVVTSGTNPTTVSDYGITDAYTKAESDANVATESTARANADAVLQSSINTERARVDAILAGAGANTDTFAEIVTLVNSVDTENDTAFAGYVLSNNTRSTNIENDVATRVVKNADIVAGSNTKITYDSKGLVISGTTPTTLAGYSIADAFTKTEVNAALALKVDDTEVAAVNLFRADKYLASQNIANMVYTNGDLTKIQYNNATDVDYEILSYTSGNLTSVNHYVASVLKGTTTLSYTNGNLVSAIFVGV